MQIKDHFDVFHDIRNILLIQLGDIGDVIWGIPAIWAIHKFYPQAGISILVREPCGSILENEPALHHIYEVIKSRNGLFTAVMDQIRFIRTLHQGKFDMAIDFRASDRGAFMAILSGARFRIAQYYHDVPFWRNRIFSRLLYIPPPEQTIVRASEHTLRILRGIGIQADDIVPRLAVKPETRGKMRLMMENQSSPWITLNPFSRWSYKEWNYKNWIQIIDWLWHDYHLATVIVGSADEQLAAGFLKNSCKSPVYNLAGRTTLSELAGILSLSRLHLGVDSGAPHIAAAVGTPTITLYGPSDWRIWAPEGTLNRVVIPDLECAPCRNKGCNDSEKSDCLETLPVEKVQMAIWKMLLEHPCITSSMTDLP